MSDADRVARERAQARRDELAEDVERHRRSEDGQRAELRTAIDELVRPALDAQKAADYPDLETIEIVGLGATGERGGFLLAKFWMDDRGSAIHGAHYLLGDGSLAASYENGPLRRIGNLDSVDVSRLVGIRDGLQRLSLPTS